MDQALPGQRSQALLELGEPLDQSLVKRLDSWRGDLSVQQQTSFQYAHLIQNEILQPVDVWHHIRVLSCELRRQEGLLVLRYAAHYVRVYNALQAHAERIDVSMWLGRVLVNKKYTYSFTEIEPSSTLNITIKLCYLSHQSSEFTLDALHSLAGVLHRRQELGSLVDDLEPPEDAGQFGLGRQGRSFDPEGLELVLAIHLATMQRPVEDEPTYVVDEVEGDHALRYLELAAAEAAFLGNRLHVADLDICVNVRTSLQ